MNLPIYKIQLGDTLGIQKMSLVEWPAVESDFLKFSNDKISLKFSINEDKRIVFGVALRADYPIYRISPGIGEYYVVFEADTIKQLYEKFMIEGKTSQVNLEHTTDTTGVYLIQSFLKDVDNGINPKGFEDIEDGSWFVAYKVENDEVWNRVKSGEFRGFSVEGFFELEKTKEPTVSELEALIDDLINEIN